MKTQTLAEATEELTQALRQFGMAVEESTRIMETLGKVNGRLAKGLTWAKDHPFATFFKPQKKGKR